jgi:hypothetical protein
MYLTQELRRIRLSFAIAFATLSICAAYAGQSHQRFAERSHSAHEAMAHNGANHHQRRRDHPSHLVEVVVDRVLSIASYMMA